MSRLGKLYRVTAENTFVMGSIVVLVVEDNTDMPGFRVVMGDVMEDCRQAYERPGMMDSGPYHYEAMHNLEPLEE